MLRVLRAANNALTALARWLAVALTAALVMVVTGNVFARYVLQTGLPWVEELSRMLFVWVVFLGACVAMQHRGHLAITFLSDRLPTLPRKLLIWVTNLLTAVFLVAMTVGGWRLAEATLAFGTQTPAMRVSLAWGFAAIPVAGVIMLITLVTHTVDGTDTQPRTEEAPA
ncbi:MAG TPA: TRAP transporter small permease [Natronosporangium sp.]